MFFTDIGVFADDGTTLVDVVYNNFIDGKIQLTSEPSGFTNGSISFFETDGTRKTNVDGFVSYPIFKSGDVFLLGFPIGYIDVDDKYYIISTNEEGSFFYNPYSLFSSSLFSNLSDFRFNFSDGFYYYNYTINSYNRDNSDYNNFSEKSFTIDLFYSLISRNQFIPSETVEFLGFLNFNRYYQYYTSFDLQRHFNELNDLLKNSNYNDYKSELIDFNAKFTFLSSYNSVSTSDIQNYLKINSDSYEGYSDKDGFSFITGKNSTNKNGIKYYFDVDGNFKTIDSMYIPYTIDGTDISFSVNGNRVSDFKIRISEYQSISRQERLSGTSTAFWKGKYWTTVLYKNLVEYTTGTFHDLPSDKISNYTLDLAAFVPMFSQSELIDDYWGNTFAKYKLFSRLEYNTFNSIGYIVEILDLSNNVLTSIPIVYIGGIDVKTPTGDPNINVSISDLPHDMVRDDDGSIIINDDFVRDDTADSVNSPTYGLYDDVDITDITKTIDNSSKQTVSFFQSLWQIVPPVFLSILIGIISLLVVLRILGR